MLDHTKTDPEAIRERGRWGGRGVGDSSQVSGEDLADIFISIFPTTTGLLISDRCTIYFQKDKPAWMDSTYHSKEIDRQHAADDSFNLEVMKPYFCMGSCLKEKCHLQPECGRLCTSGAEARDIIGRI